MADTTDTVNIQLSRIETAKSNIKEAIINKGVTVPTVALISDYPTYIAQIQTGITPSGNIELTTQTGTDVTNYATASVRNASLSISSSGSVSPTISVNSSGLITATNNSSKSVTVSASTTGWFENSTTDSISVTGTATQQLTTITAPAPTLNGTSTIPIPANATVSYTLDAGYHASSETKSVTIPNATLTTDSIRGAGTILLTVTPTGSVQYIVPTSEGFFRSVDCIKVNAASIPSGNLQINATTAAATNINVSDYATASVTGISAANIRSGTTYFGTQGSLVVQKYYEGTTAPSSSLGVNGDIYLKTA